MKADSRYFVKETWCSWVHVRVDMAGVASKTVTTSCQMTLLIVAMVILAVQYFRLSCSNFDGSWMCCAPAELRVRSPDQARQEMLQDRPNQENSTHES